MQSRFKLDVSSNFSSFETLQRKKEKKNFSVVHMFNLSRAQKYGLL